MTHRTHEEVDFEKLKGMTLTKATGKVGDDEMAFETELGEVYELYHRQDCCESVVLDDICGDLNDLIGTPILLAEEVSNEGDEPPFPDPDWIPESYTWTFYKLATIKGAVTIRWFGESNGYYSEEVELYKVK